MSNTLVIDTSYGSTVGVVGHQPIVETDSRTHVERLQINIATAVRQAGLEASDIERIVVGIGPAPFTGLRAGIVAAKALAFAVHAELVGQDILTPQIAMMQSYHVHPQAFANYSFFSAKRGEGGGEANSGKAFGAESAGSAMFDISMSDAAVMNSESSARIANDHQAVKRGEKVGQYGESKDTKSVGNETLGNKPDAIEDEKNKIENDKATGDDGKRINHLTLAVNDARRKQLYFALGSGLDAADRAGNAYVSDILDIRGPSVGLDNPEPDTDTSHISNMYDEPQTSGDRINTLKSSPYDADIADTVKTTDTANKVDADTARRQGSISLIIDMDIDYPANIVMRVNDAVDQLQESTGQRYVVDVVGHGAGKYAREWNELQSLAMVVDASVLDLGSRGLSLFAQCALDHAEQTGTDQPRQDATEQSMPTQPTTMQAVPMKSESVRGASEQFVSEQTTSEQAASRRPASTKVTSRQASSVEPLYLRRPDVFVPNPLKHVLHHAQADKVE